MTFKAFSGIRMESKRNPRREEKRRKEKRRKEKKREEKRVSLTVESRPILRTFSLSCGKTCGKVPEGEKTGKLSKNAQTAPLYLHFPLGLL